MKLAFGIAYRFLKSGKMQTWIIILGIAIGVSVQVFIGSLISGLQKSLVDKTIGNASHITVSAEQGTFIEGYGDIISDIDNNIEEVRAYSPTIAARGTLVNDVLTSPVTLRGFDFDLANNIYEFDEKMTEGRVPSAIDEVALGIGFAEELDLVIGDTLTIDVPLVGSKTLTVVGFFDFKVAAINNSWGVSSLGTVQELLGLGNVVDSIETQLFEEAIFEAETIALLVEEQPLVTEYEVSNWIANNEELLSGLQGQSISSLMIQVFVMISVILGIASVLAIIVMQKSKQIGILKAMGIQNSDASFIFLFEGLILGLLGAIFGVLLGLGLAYSFTTFALNADGTPVIPLFIDPEFITISALIAVAASLGASLIPARKSSKLSVIEVIRNA